MTRRDFFGALACAAAIPILPRLPAPAGGGAAPLVFTVQFNDSLAEWQIDGLEPWWEWGTADTINFVIDARAEAGR